MGLERLKIATCFLFVFTLTELYSATYTTTAVVGTWDIGGSPGAGDNIVVNHNWSSYGGFGTIANYTGTMTINNGGWLKVTGDFTNFSGHINIVAGGTFYITGSVSTASEAFGGSITVNGTWRANGSFANGFCTIAGTGYIRVDGAYSGGCNGTVTLPVELISFDAQKNYAKVDITWTTASETNSDYYSVTRSYNGIDFISIGTLPAAGSSNTLLNYSFVDSSPLRGLNYYQLVEFDNDGQTQKSKVVSVNFLGNQNMITQIYPNPSSDEVFLYFNSIDGGVYQLELTDVLGNELCKAQVSAMKGENKYSLSLLPYPDAQYFIRLIDNSGQSSAISIIKR